jgi:hypothetical protein
MTLSLLFSFFLLLLSTRDLNSNQVKNSGPHRSSPVTSTHKDKDVSSSMGTKDFSSSLQNDHLHYHIKRDKIPIIHNHNIDRVGVLHKGFKFLDSILNPFNCKKLDALKGLPYMIVDIGIPGGFASQFQLAASIWMRTLAETNFSMPILVRGPLVGYSEGKECENFEFSWNCYFQATSRCEKEILKSGQLIKTTNRSLSNEESIPPAFQMHDFSLWWAIIQSYLFRLQPYIEQYILKTTTYQKMTNGRIFPYGLPIAGIHVRHGDKQVDHWYTFSLQEELNALSSEENPILDCNIKGNYSTVMYEEQELKEERKSPVSAAASTSTGTKKTVMIERNLTRNICFHSLNLSNYYSNIILIKALQNQTFILKQHDLQSYLSALHKNESTSSFSISSKDLLKAKKSFYGNEILHHHYHDHETIQYYHHNLLDPFMIYNISYNVSVIRDMIEHHDLDHLAHFHSLSSSFDAVSSSDSSAGHQHHHHSSHIATSGNLSLVEEMLFKEKYMIPLDIFIASDDANVIRYATSAGYFVNKEGVSQQTHGNAMISIVIKHKETSFEASLQIILDIFLLSQCSTLIGMAASQVYRMAVALSFAKGILRQAKALDYNSLRAIYKMSRKYNLPCPEPFVP